MEEKIRNDRIDLAMTADLSFIVSIIIAENSTSESCLMRYVAANLVAILALFFSIIFKSIIVWIMSLILILGVMIWCFVELKKAEERRIEMDALRNEAKEYFMKRIRQLEIRDVGREEAALESQRRALESLRVFLRIAEASEFRGL